MRWDESNAFWRILSKSDTGGICIVYTNGWKKSHFFSMYFKIQMNIYLNKYVCLVWTGAIHILMPWLVACPLLVPSTHLLFLNLTLYDRRQQSRGHDSFIRVGISMNLFGSTTSQSSFSFPLPLFLFLTLFQRKRHHITFQARLFESCPLGLLLVLAPHAYINYIYLYPEK